MKYLIILTFTGLFSSCGLREAKDAVAYYDRFDLANTIDTTNGTYNPKVDSTYIFPADSADIVTITDTSDYRIKTIIFPVRNKYVTMFRETTRRKEKFKYRDYKLQIEITDHEGLYIKKVFTKYDLPDSVIESHYFINEVKFKRLEKDEFAFDIKFICFGDDGCFPPRIKYYVHLMDGVRFETYSDITYDSTLQAVPAWEVD
jgi:hypothetical protein